MADMGLPRNLDIDLLRAFATIAERGTVSAAADRLSRNQSTVSLQLKRLEEALGGPLFKRTTRRMALSNYGETLLPYAHRILALNDEIVDRVTEPALEGNVRLGAPEDFATTYMPEILGEFVKAHPLVSLEVTCELTLKLMQGFRAGRFDLVLVKREPLANKTGTRVWREALVWVGAKGVIVAQSGAVPLVLSPEPCVYRKRAVEALKKSKRKWRIAYTCGSLSGAQAAVRAGLGFTVLPKAIVPSGLHIIESGALPSLRDTEIALLANEPISAPAARLREHIVFSLENSSQGGE
jgi:DNA-binding transcriptional LysR family regulator